MQTQPATGEKGFSPWAVCACLGVFSAIAGRLRRTLSAMQVLPIDVPAVIATTLGLLSLLTLVTGFTVRFAFRPMVEALALAWSNRGTARQEIALLEKRIALLERELELRRLPAVSAVSAVPEAPARNSSVSVGA